VPVSVKASGRAAGAASGRAVRDTASLTSTLARWAASLELDEVPARVVELVKSQILSELAAVRAGARHELGRRLMSAFGPPLQEDPKRSAYVLAGLGILLDFDDTAYAGHLSHSTVGVPLAYAQALQLDGKNLILSVLAANECAARITAAATLGPFRGQTAAHTHLAGSVVGRCKAQRASPELIAGALGLAFAMPPWSLMPAFMGSDAKVLTAATPVLTGLDACDAAFAGLAGRLDILEHEKGFLAKFATLPLPEAVTLGLGTRWHTETLSFKVYPGCAYLDSAVDCAVALHDDLRGVDPEAISEVVVHGSVFTVGMEAESEPYLDGAGSPVSALEFSAAYAVATALLTGALSPRDFDADRVAEPGRLELASKVRVAHDMDLTRRALRATAPIGEALRQAGDRAREWLHGVGGEAAVRLIEPVSPPAEDFQDAEKAIGARVEVHLAGGAHLEHSCDVARGAAGPVTRSTHRSITREKFLASGGSLEVADELSCLEELSPAAVAKLLAACLA